MKKKTSFIVGLSVLATMSLSVALCMTNTNGVMANAAVARQDGMTFDGFSVRVNVSEEDTTGEGVRFHVGMTTALYESLLNEEGTALKNGVSTGTVIIPTQLKTGDLTKDTLKATVVETTDKWFAVKDEDEQTTTGMQSIVYLWDIPSTNYGNDISVVGYINDNGTITYSDEAARSMSWVAQEEYNDTNSKFDADMKAELKETYIDKKVVMNVDGTTTTETVEYGKTLSVDAPEKTGYTFDGWFNKSGTAKWDMTNTVINPINLYAQYTRNKGYEILVDPNSTVASDYEVRNDSESGSVNKQLVPAIVGGTETIGTTEKVIKINVADGTTLVSGQGHYIFHCKNLTKARMQNFDYVTVNGYAEGSANGLAFCAASGWNRIKTMRQADQKGAFSFTIPAEYLTDDTFRFGFSDYTGDSSSRLQNLYITSIVGGYNDVETDKELNLLTKTGLTAAEFSGTYFENESGTKTTIDNLSAFTPTEGGKIVLKLNVKGYVASEVEIKVNVVLAYNDFLLLGLNDETNYVVSQRETSTQTQHQHITQTIVDGTNIGADGNVLYINTSTMPQNGHMRVHIPKISTTQLNYFDYYTIVGYVDNTGTEFSIGAASSTTGEVDTDERLLNIVGNFSYKVESKYFVGEYLQFCFGDYTRLRENPAKGMYISSITGGYNDVEAGTEVNLVEKTGFTETELAGTYFEKADGTTDPIADLAAFAPTEAGKIMLVINKTGYKQTTVAINVVAQA